MERETLNRKSLRSFLMYPLVLVCISAMLISCGQAAPTSRMPVSRLNTVQAWISEHAIKLNTTDPNATFDDLQPLQQIVSDAPIVGLGEATHGSHEFFTMKHRLLEFLVEQKGFSMFSLEGNWSAGEIANEYVLTGKGSAEDVLKQFQFWTWNTREVLALVKWMRAYDADPQHVQKVRFTGFDCQQVESITFDNIKGYFNTVDPQRVADVTTLYADIERTANTQLAPATAKQYATNAQKVYDLLKGHQAQYEALSSPQAFALALQDARVIVQYAQLMSIDMNTQQGWTEAGKERDSFMAENIAWLHEHSDGGAKMVLWAHNGHIGISDSDGYASMGLNLHLRYQGQYLPIGFSFYQGAFNAHGMDAHGNVTSLQPFTMQAPDKDSYNYTLGSLNIQQYMLDLRNVPKGAVGQWMDGPHSFYSIGSVYSSEDQSQDYASVSLPSYFAVLIHIQKVTASQLLPF
jgi:erythromycin esterase